MSESSSSEGMRHWDLGTAQLTLQNNVAHFRAADGAGLDWFTHAPLNEVAGIYAELAKEGKFYLIVDLSAFKGKMPKITSGDQQKLDLSWFKLTLLVGLSFPVRLATKALMVGMALAGHPDTTRFADTAAEAMKIIEEHRAKTAEKAKA